MSFTVILQKMSTEKNRVNKSSHITNIRSLEGTLRDECSILRPVIQFRIDDVADLKMCNYMYIEQFGRYYFVDDITSVRTKVVEISAHVDVLQTYQEQILSNSAIIHRSGTSYNLFLDDAQFKVYNCPHILTKNFPSGFPTDNEFLLAVSGSVSTS